LSLAVIGAFLNALGILLGALWGLARREPPTAAAQKFFQSALGALTAFCGLQLVWLNVGVNFSTVVKQLFIAALAVVLGNWLGKLLGLQKISNRLGRHAGALLGGGTPSVKIRPADGFAGATILFCAAPLGILGAVTDGLADYFYPLALKAAMEGLAMTSFVKTFRWPVALAAIPVFIFLNLLSLAVRFGVRPWLEAPALIASVNAAAGLVACATALVVLGVRRVELANYLPALALAPLLTRLLA
jgi:uncharacterized membrane protein YqgA involved in biofilm formation